MTRFTLAILIVVVLYLNNAETLSLGKRQNTDGFCAECPNDITVINPDGGVATVTWPIKYDTFEWVYGSSTPGDSFSKTTEVTGWYISPEDFCKCKFKVNV